MPRYGFNLELNGKDNGVSDSGYQFHGMMGGIESDRETGESIVCERREHESGSRPPPNVIRSSTLEYEDLEQNRTRDTKLRRRVEREKIVEAEELNQRAGRKAQLARFKAEAQRTTE